MTVQLLSVKWQTSVEAEINAGFVFVEDLYPTGTPTDEMVIQVVGDDRHVVLFTLKSATRLVEMFNEILAHYPVDGDPEIAALPVVLHAFQRIDSKARQRVLEWVESKLASEKSGGGWVMGNVCSRCGADIVWLKRAEFDGTPAVGAKANPIDPLPHPDGKLVLAVDRGLYRFATDNEKEMQRLYGKNLYRSHFDSCPNAGEFRPKKQGRSLFDGD